MGFNSDVPTIQPIASKCRPNIIQFEYRSHQNSSHYSIKSHLNIYPYQE